MDPCDSSTAHKTGFAYPKELKLTMTEAVKWCKTEPFKCSQRKRKKGTDLFITREL
jgi:hypothetical protein